QFEAGWRERFAAFCRSEVDLAGGLQRLRVEDDEHRLTNRRDIDLAATDDEVTRMRCDARLELLYEGEIVLPVDSDRVVACVANPDIAVFVVDRNAVDGEEPAFAVAARRCCAGRRLREDFKRFRVYL